MAGLEFQLVVHARLEFQLYAVHVVRSTVDGNGGSSSNLSRARSCSNNSTFDRGIAIRVDTVRAIMASSLIRNDSSIAEGILCVVLLIATGSQVGKELSDRTKTETRCGGRGLCAGSAKLFAVGAEAVDRYRSSGGALLVVLLKLALVLLTAPAEEDQTENKPEAKNDTNSETSLCTTGHSRLLRLCSCA